MLSQGAGAFANPVSYAAGSWPVGIVSGDLNGDGKMDLALASNTVDPNGFSDGALAVFLGSGSGAFSPATFVGIDSGAVGIVLTDFNLDGVPDILVTNCCGLNDVNLLLGNGDGTFQGIEMAAGDSLEGIAVADFNGDRKPDLVIATQASDVAGNLHGYVTVFLNLPYAGPAATAVNAASFINGPVAPGSIASAFGIDLATASGATEVQFVDSAGNVFPAQVFAAASGQVNFQVPSGAQSSVGTAIFTSGDGKTSLASVILSPVAPGIFAEPGRPSVVAGGVLRVHADGTRTTGSTAQCGANDSCTAVPINLNPKTDTVYLILYATGLRGAAQSQVTVKIGTMVLSPTYAGAQGSFVGLDQIDVILPYSLKGAGDVIVEVTAAGLVTNPAHITIQ